MKHLPLAAVSFALAFGLTACTRSDDRNAREQARQTAAQLQHDSKVVLHDAEVGARKANKELTKDLNQARAEAHRAIDDRDANDREKRDEQKPQDNPPQ